MKDESGVDQPPSRSARKRVPEDLQPLGARLAKLTDGDRRRLPIDADLANALDEYRAITTNGAKRRQLQYIGRLMREVELESIEAALADIEGRSAASRFQQHDLDRWRATLIGPND